VVSKPELIVNKTGTDVCPPLDTLTDAVPTAVIKLALTEAVNCVALTNVVGRLVPFHWTVAPEVKSIPTTPSVNAEPPAATEVGHKLVIVACVVGSWRIRYRAS
jgi:hypothetical protein